MPEVGATGAFGKAEDMENRNGEEGPESKHG